MGKTMKEFIFTKNSKKQKNDFKKFLGEIEEKDSFKFTLKYGIAVQTEQLTNVVKIITDILFDWDNADKLFDFDINYIHDLKSDKEEITVKIKKTKMSPKKLELLKAGNRAFEILKDFRIWDIGKYDNEIKTIAALYKKYDKSYIYRYNLYELLMKEPKFKKYTEKEKIIFAMQMGALDIHELIRK